MFGKKFELNDNTIPIVEEIGRNMPGGFFIYKDEAPEELLYANNYVFNLFGCDDIDDFKKLTGYTFQGMVHPDDYKSVTNSIKGQIARSDMDYIEYRIIRKDGSTRWVDDYGHYTETEAYGGIFYVFISDITEKRERMEEDAAVRSAVINALTGVFNTLWLINNVETERISLYHGMTEEGSIHADITKEGLNFSRYSDACEHYIASVVAEKDRERLRGEASISNLLKELSDKRQFSVKYLRECPDGPRHYQIEFIKVDMPAGKVGIMMGFRDVDEETKRNNRLEEARRQEMEERIALQEKLLEEQKQRELQDRMFIALSSDYRSVYYVNLDRDEAVCYLEDKRFGEEAPFTGDHFPFLRDFTEYAYNHVKESYREGFLNFIQPDNIRRELLKTPVISYRFLEICDGKEAYSMLRMAGVRHLEDREDHIVHAIGAGFTDIDEEMRHSMTQQQVLVEALAAAEEANKAKTAFLSSMSHEIRTPMNAIIGLDGLALKKENLDEETKEYLEKIGESAHHLLSLINDILDMSRIDAGRLVLRKEEFSLRKMLEQINTMVSSQCNEKGLEYECSVIGGVSDYYIGDDMKLKQVLINILSNAIKFTEAPGNIKFIVERIATYEDQSTLKFVIKDTGIGMDKSFLPKIFDSFTQENSDRNNKYGSTGLGMAITKNIVELMNGKISVESEKGVGSEFTVIITLKKCENQGPVARYISPGDMKVLIVDDEKVAAEHARLILDEVGIKSDTCYSGEDALHMVDLEHTKHTPYNLIILDWKMPGMDGLEVARRIRERYDRESTVIILTAFNWDEILEEAAMIGVDSFLAKPLFASNVIDEFERIARKNSMSLSKETRRADLAGRRLLLAEDIIINAEIMGHIIGMKGASIEHAENGRIALEMFEKSEPWYYDAVLMDIRLPEMDGLEAASRIRALDREDAKKVPVIALTANAFDEDVQRSLQVGMNAHLSKPVDPDLLYQTLEELIWEKDNRKENS